MVAMARRPGGAEATAGAPHGINERVEIVGQLQRSLALLRGCDAPGIKAQIASLIAALRTRLERIAGPHPAGDGNAFPSDCLIPAADSALDITEVECRSYAIQCESLASMATDPGQREMLRALARLWRALATSRSGR